MKVEFQIQGAMELERLIASMPAKLAKKGIRKAVRAAHQIIYESILRKIQALPDSGLLKRRSLKMAMLLNFRIKIPKRQRAGTYAMDAGFDNTESAGLVYYAKGAHTPITWNAKDKHGNTVDKIGAEKGRSFVPAALEYGHGSNKEAAARPFMRPGVEEAKDKARNTLAVELVKELDAIVAEARGAAA